MVCNDEEVGDAIKNKISLVMNILRSTLGIFVAIFFFVTSYLGVKYITDTKNLWQLLRKAWGRLMGLFQSPYDIFKTTVSKSMEQSRLTLPYYLLGCLIPVVLTLFFIRESLDFLGALFGFAMLFVVIYIMIGGNDVLLQAVLSGMNMGLFISVVIFIGTQYRALDTGSVSLNVLFILVIMYMVLALWVIAPGIKESTASRVSKSVQELVGDSVIVEVERQ